MKEKNLQPRLLYQQGPHSNMKEKSKALQTSKSSENSAPPNQLYNKAKGTSLGRKPREGKDLPKQTQNN